MRIGMDARLLVEERTGVETYFQEILRRLLGLGGDEEYLLFRGDGLRPRLPEGRWRVVPARGTALMWGLTGKVRAERLDLFYSPVTAFPLSGPARTVVTVHDLSWHHASDSYSVPQRFRHRKWTALAARRADRIVAVSESTRADLAALHPECAPRLAVVPPGVDEGFFAAVPRREVERVRARYHLPPRFLFALGTLHRRKNFPALVEAFDRFRARNAERIGLFIAGRGGGDSVPLRARIARSPHRADIILAGYVPGEDLPALYAAADLVVMISRYEGFGIPAAEAMAGGTPVLVSRLPVFEEVCGPAALKADPGDPDSIADGIARSLASEPARMERIREGIERARRYRWEDSARRLLDLFREVGGAAA